MQFKMHVKDSRDDWWEECNQAEIKDKAMAEDWAKRTLAFYNGTLRAGESPRELLEVQMGGSAELKHKWEKQNLVTIAKRGQYYDLMRCSRCGCTAKRFGLVGIERDRKFKAKKWETCPGK